MDDWGSLMERAQRGDEDAYRLLLSSIASYAHGYVVRALKGSSAADDIVQEVLLAVHLNRETYDSSRPFGPWFFTLLRHKLLDEIRKGSRVSKRREEFAKFHSQEPVTDDFQGLYSDAERAIGMLSSKQRELFLLSRVEGRTNSEVGAQVKMSEGAVKVALHRILAFLRLQIEV